MPACSAMPRRARHLPEGEIRRGAAPCFTGSAVSNSDVSSSQHFDGQVAPPQRREDAITGHPPCRCDVDQRRPDPQRRPSPAGDVMIAAERQHRGVVAGRSTGPLRRRRHVAKDEERIGLAPARRREDLRVSPIRPGRML